MARYVINCAGVASDKVAGLIGDTSFYMKPRLGEYLLLHKNQGNKTNKIIFPTPHPVKGKGVLVQKTLWGNLILGPTARDVLEDGTTTEPLEDIMTFILSKCRELVPSFDASETIHSFCGVRAKSSRGDWVIEPKDRRNLKYSKTAKEAKGVDPKKNVVCKCEKVTEAEIVEACRRSLPIDSTQAMRKRNRAGMGHCQGDPKNYDCESRVAAIIAREPGLPLSAVGRRPWPATSMLPGRWPSEAQKKAIDKLGK